MTIDPGMLDAGEQVVWSGRPNTLRYAFRNSLVTLPFGIVFLTFSLFWVYGARSGAGGNTAFWLLGIPFVAVGAGMVLSPLWHLFRSARTTYVLTNRRALSVVAGPLGRRFSVPLRQMGFIDVRPAVDGSGTIYFKETVIGGSNGTTTRREGFVAVPDVLTLERLLRAAIEHVGGAERR